jgi:hypothetical protein
VHGVGHPALSFVMLSVLYLDIQGHKQTLFTNFLATQNYFTLNVLFVDIKELKATNISYSRILCHAHKYFAIPVDTSVV